MMHCSNGLGSPVALGRDYESSRLGRLGTIDPADFDAKAVVGAAKDGEGWRSGALMVQRMPPEGAVDSSWRDTLEEWRRARVLVAQHQL